MAPRSRPGPGGPDPAAGGDRDVLANDADSDGDALTAKLVAGAAKGALTINVDDSFTYQPRRNFHGTIAFTYVVGDEAGNTDTAKATITALSRPG